MKGPFTGKIYASVEVEFDKVWNDLSQDEQKSIIADNIDLLDDKDMIRELENRGYSITED